jgi:hypothetical protein
MARLAAVKLRRGRYGPRPGPYGLLPAVQPQPDAQRKRNNNDDGTSQ